jgi:hypothetical protein
MPAARLSVRLVRSRWYRPWRNDIDEHAAYVAFLAVSGHRGMICSMDALDRDILRPSKPTGG